MSRLISLEDSSSSYNRSQKSKSPFPNRNAPQTKPNPHAPSSAAAENLEMLRRHNQQLIEQFNQMYLPGTGRSSILDDVNQSIQSGTESKTNSNYGSYSHSQQPNSNQSLSNSRHYTPSLGPAPNKAIREEEEASIAQNHISFQGPLNDSKTSSTLRGGSKPLFTEKPQQKSYFEYSDFDLYVESMSKRIGKAEIKNKVLELKQLANTLKLIAEADPEEDLDGILMKHTNLGPLPVSQEIEPLYKTVTKKAAVDQLALHHFKELTKSSDPLKQKNQDLTKISVGGIITLQRMESGSTVLGSANKKMGNSFNFQGIDSQNKISDRHEESFEAYLLEQGIDAPVYSKAQNKGGMVGSIAQSLPEHSSSTNNNHHGDNSFSFKHIEEHNGPLTNYNDEGISAKLHSALMQHLKEMKEVKDILKEGYGGGESRELMKSVEEKKENDYLILLPGTQSNEEAEIEHKLQERQMERLVKRVQSLNEKILKLEQENLESRKASQVIKKYLRTGRVKMSDYITYEVDLTRMTLDHIYTQFELRNKYMYVCTSHLSLCNDALDQEEQGQRFHYSEIEQIYYLEKAGSTFFVLKSLEKETEKSAGSDSLRLSSQIKMRSFENISNFYFLEIEDQGEMALWESVFFTVNFKIIAGNLSFSVNKSDFLFTLRSFLQRYLQTSGETSKSLVDSINFKSLQNSSFQMSSRVGLTNDSGAEKLGIMDVMNRKRMGGGYPVANTQTSLVNVKKRSEESDPETKEDVPASSQQRRQLQKQRSFPSRGASVEDDLSSVEEGNSVSESNPENSPDAREEKNRALYLKSVNKISNFELDDQVFSKHLNLLIDGVVFSKYGKWGKNHEKHIKISSDLANIQWTHPVKANKRRGFIDIDTIMSIAIGKKSPYFAKKKLSPPELDLCFSIKAKARSLHLQAPDIQSRDCFIDALEYILKEKGKLKKLAEQSSKLQKEQKKLI